MDSPPFEATAEVERPTTHAQFAWLASIFAALPIMFLGVWLIDHEHAPTLGKILMGLSIATMAGALWQVVKLARKGGRTKKSARVRAMDGALEIDGERAFARIATAYYQPRQGAAATVRVSGGALRTLDVVVQDEEQAKALLRALKIDPARSIARFKVHQGMFANKSVQTVVSTILTMGALQAVQFLPSGLKIPVGALLVIATIWNLLQSTVSIGPDGVLVSSPLGLRSRFHPFSNIADAKANEWGVTLEMKSGRTIELRTRNAKLAAKGTDETRDALVARIKAGIGALIDAESTLDVSSLVARGSRPIDEWLRALTTVTHQEGYRSAAVPAVRLWRVVEDPAAEPTARAGAAVALRESLDDEGRARLRVAADNSVHPKVRVVLETLAQPCDDATLEAALVDCEDDEPRTLTK